MNDNSSPAAINAANSGAALIRLHRYGFVVVEGAKSLQLLQGQFTCNVSEAGPAAAIPGAYCTPKGRAISSFLLHAQTPDRVLLRMRDDIVDSTVAVLSRYAAFSKVGVSRSPAAPVVYGLLGPDIAERMIRVLDCWPAQRHAVAAPETGVSLLRLDTAGALAEIWVESDAAQSLCERLTPHFDQPSESVWNLAVLRRGIAEIQNATRDLFVPQMLGYEQSGAISFKKGCYTGQEIIARTQYRGALKRHLHWGECAGAALPAVGSELRDAANGRSVGVVVEAANTPESTCEVLAVISDDAAGNLVTQDGRGLRLGPIPCDMI